jgi:hypothetical protein
MKCEAKCDICLGESQRLLQEIDFQHLIENMESYVLSRGHHASF